MPAPASSDTQKPGSQGEGRDEDKDKGTNVGKVKLSCRNSSCSDYVAQKVITKFG